MTDTATVWNVQAFYGDWVQNGTQLQIGNDLQTAILISLFTDRIASTDDIIPDGSGDPRGWPGDQDQLVPVGSRLWLLDRSKQTKAVLNAATDYINEALKWLIDDGVVARFDVTTEFTRPGMLGARVAARKQDGSVVAMKFEWAWQGVS